MREIEAKILAINRTFVLKKLKALGARKVFSGRITAVYYDFKNDKLSSQGKVLRLRKKGPKIELAYKQKRSKKNAKIMDEHETLLTDFPAAQRILRGLGLKEYRRVKKHRTSYALGDSRFEIDTIEGLPTFLEIESPSVKKLAKAVKKLGYSKSDAKPWSTWDLFKHYKKY